MPNRFIYEKPFKAVCLTTPHTFAIKEFSYSFDDNVSIPQMSSNGIIALPGKTEDFQHFVLLKVEGCGICSTDLHMYGGKRFLYEQANFGNPVIPGHEIFGKVVWADGSHAHLMDQDVVVDPIIDCFKEPQCRYCQQRKNYMHVPFQEMGICGRVPGGMAQYTIGLAKNCYPVNRSLTAKQKALIEPLATVLYALRDILKLDANPRSYAIMGSGNVGLLALQCIKLLNRRNFVALIDKNPIKLNLARQLGADEIIDAELNKIDAVRDCLPKIGKPNGFDVVLEMSGADSAINLIPHIATKCAQILLYGLGHRHVEIDQFDLFIEKELGMVSSLGASNQKRFQEAVDLVPSLESDRIISHEYRFDTLGQLFQRKILDKTHIKGVLLP